MIKVKTVVVNFEDGAKAILDFLGDSKSRVCITVPYDDEECHDEYEAEITSKVVNILRVLKNVL